MQRVLVLFLTILTVQTAGTFLLAQDLDPYLGEWTGKGAFRSAESEQERPIACRYRGTEDAGGALIQLRCSTRQNARILEVRLIYGEASHIFAAEIVRPVAQAGQRLDVGQDANGLTISAQEGRRLTLRRFQKALKLRMTNPGESHAEVTLSRR